MPSFDGGEAPRRSPSSLGSAPYRAISRAIAPKAPTDVLGARSHICHWGNLLRLVLLPRSRTFAGIYGWRDHGAQLDSPGVFGRQHCLCSEASQPFSKVAVLSKFSVSNLCVGCHGDVRRTPGSHNMRRTLTTGSSDRRLERSQCVVFGKPRRGSMMWIKQLRWSSAQPRVAQPHR